MINSTRSKVIEELSERLYNHYFEHYSDVLVVYPGITNIIKKGSRKARSREIFTRKIKTGRD